jgi:hypothetical protein
MTRSVTRTGARSLWAMTAFAFVLSCGSALAQTSNDPRLRNPQIQAAYADWRKLAQKEVDCIDEKLRNKRSSVWLTIQQGIHPSDAKVAAIRTECRTQARSPASAPGTSAAATGPGAQALAGARADDAAKAAADRAAAARAAVEKEFADNVAAEKLAADKLNAEKYAAERPPVEVTRPVDDKLAWVENKTAADNPTIENVSIDKLPADKVVANKPAAAKPAADKLATDKSKQDRAATQKVSADRAAVAPARNQAVPVNADATSTTADADRTQQDTATTPSEAALAFAASESRMSFIYGLVSGPAVFCLGGIVFLLLRRKPHAGTQSAAGWADAYRDDQSELSRTVAAVMAEQARRDGHYRLPATRGEPPVH